MRPRRRGDFAIGTWSILEQIRNTERSDDLYHPRNLKPADEPSQFHGGLLWIH
jgi:hypothetical protein